MESKIPHFWLYGYTGYITGILLLLPNRETGLWLPEPLGYIFFVIYLLTL